MHTRNIIGISLLRHPRGMDTWCLPIPRISCTHPTNYARRWRLNTCWRQHRSLFCHQNTETHPQTARTHARTHFYKQSDHPKRTLKRDWQSQFIWYHRICSFTQTNITPSKHYSHHSGVAVTKQEWVKEQYVFGGHWAKPTATGR